MKTTELSDLKIGVELHINMGGKTTKHIVRKRIDLLELKRNKCSKWAKEETEEEYQEYKRVIKYYVEKEFCEIKK